MCPPVESMTRGGQLRDSVNSKRLDRLVPFNHSENRERGSRTLPSHIIDIGTTNLKVLNPVGNGSDSSGWLDYKREEITTDHAKFFLIDASWFEGQIRKGIALQESKEPAQEAIVATGRSSNLVVKYKGKTLILDSVHAHITDEQKAIIQKHLGTDEIRESSALSMLLTLYNNPDFITAYFGEDVPFESLHITTMLGLVAELITQKELPIPPDEKKSFYGGIVPEDDDNQDQLHACCDDLFYKGQPQSEEQIKFMKGRNAENVYVINDTPAEVGLLTQLCGVGIFPEDAMGFATDSWLKVGLFTPDGTYGYRSMRIFASMNHHWVRPLYGLLSEDQRHAAHMHSDISRVKNHYRLSEGASIRGLVDMGKNPYIFMPVGETGRLFKKSPDGLREISLDGLNEINNELPDVLDAVVAIEQGIVYGGRYTAEQFAQEYKRPVDKVVLYGALANVDPNFAHLCASCWPGTSFSILELSNGGEAATSMWRAEQAKKDGTEEDFMKELYEQWKDKIQEGIYSIPLPQVCWDGKQCPEEHVYQEWKRIYEMLEKISSH